MLHSVVKTLLRPAPASDQSDMLLREQYAALCRQIPLMYLLMTINAAFLATVASRSMPLMTSIGIPLFITIVTMMRAAIWLTRSKREISTAQMRRHLRGTLRAAAFLSLLYGSWGFVLFSTVDPMRSSSIALYIFVGAIGCCYCLQALPLAARLVLLFGAAPTTVELLMSGDWYLVGTGLTFLLVAIVSPVPTRYGTDDGDQKKRQSRTW